MADGSWRPSYKHLGSRVEDVLRQAEEQAAQILESARREAEGLRAQTKSTVLDSARAEAEQIRAAALEDAARIRGGECPECIRRERDQPQSGWRRWLGRA